MARCKAHQCPDDEIPDEHVLCTHHWDLLGAEAASWREWLVDAYGTPEWPHVLKEVLHELRLIDARHRREAAEPAMVRPPRPTDAQAVALWAAHCALDDPERPALWLQVVPARGELGVSWWRTEDDETPPRGTLAAACRCVALVPYTGRTRS